MTGRARVAFEGVAIIAVVGVGLGAAAPANAASGDAAAIGAAAQIDVRIGDFTFTRAVSVGEVVATLPGSQADRRTDVVLVDAAVAQLTIGESAIAAESTLPVAEAASDVEEISFKLFGVPVVTLDAAEAAVQCTYGETPQGEVSLGQLSILGVPVTVDETTTVGEQSVLLDDEVQLGEDPADTVDLSRVRLTVRVTQEVVINPAGAVAISLAAQATLSGTHESQVFENEVVAQLILASALCETPPAPVAVTAITPPSGPVAGGQTVTITGSGFTPQTTVRFGDTLATDVVVDAAGTSLTAVAPSASAPGAATVTVARPDGSSTTLSYLYVAVAPTPTPSATPTAPGRPLPPTLAATGADTGTLPLFAGGMFGAGMLVLAASRSLRRCAWSLAEKRRRP